MRHWVTLGLTAALVVAVHDYARASSCGAAISSCEPCSQTVCYPRVRYKACYITVVEEKPKVCYQTVRKTVWQECRYKVQKPVRETVWQECRYKVCKPVCEEFEREEKYIVYCPVQETHYREVREVGAKTGLGGTISRLQIYRLQTGLRNSLSGRY
jgi:hypothetical protein